MAIKVKAVERNLSFDKNSEKWAYMLQADLYNKLSQSKVIQCNKQTFFVLFFVKLFVHFAGQFRGSFVPVYC